MFIKSLHSNLKILLAVQRSQFSTTPLLKMSEEVVSEKVKNIGVITLNRAKQLNAINLPMVRNIYKQLKTWEIDPSVRMILIQNIKGSNAFCAGGDIKAIRESAVSGNVKDALVLPWVEVSV